MSFTDQTFLWFWTPVRGCHLKPNWPLNFQYCLVIPYFFLRQDVEFDLSANADTFMGDNIEIVLKATNNSKEKRTVSGRLALNTMYYTGVHYKNVNFLSIEEKAIEKGQCRFIDICFKRECPFDVYKQKDLRTIIMIFLWMYTHVCRSLLRRNLVF